MTSREKRRLRKQFDAQIEQERNGAPIPGEIAERMTKDKPAVILHQVVVTERGTGRLIPFGPMMIQDAAGMFCEAINRQILLGAEKVFTSAAVVPMTPIQAGA